MRLSSLFAIPFAVIVVGQAACASPAARWWDRAATFNFAVSVVEGDSFRHVVLEKRGGPAQLLHVYLDGDGTPWQGREPASDPTPRNALVLELMASDGALSLYLGRPCYHGLASDPGCRPPIWTMQRYSEAVVASMAVSLRRLLVVRSIDRLAWIGYSGGGVLAMLLAPRFPETAAIVTVAANLDIDAWADYHGYLRLAGSLNPAGRGTLDPSIYQRHYVGGRDRVVPPSIVVGSGVRPEHLTVVPGYDHICCWSVLWPSILADLRQSAR